MKSIDLIDYLDGLLLESCRKWARLSQRLIGCDTFVLGKFFAVLGLSYFVFKHLLFILCFRTLVIAPTGLLYVAVYGFLLKVFWNSGTRYKPGFPNRNRKMELAQVLRGMVLVMFLIRAITALSSIAQHPLLLIFELMDFGEVGCMLLFASFMSVEPDPPSESKLRKLLNKINSMLSPLPAVEPA
jgi:hypothetical protein